MLHNLTVTGRQNMNGTHLMFQNLKIKRLMATTELIEGSARPITGCLYQQCFVKTGTWMLSEKHCKMNWDMLLQINTSNTHIIYWKLIKLVKISAVLIWFLPMEKTGRLKMLME